jgi:hypothetical protein
VPDKTEAFLGQPSDRAVRRSPYLSGLVADDRQPAAPASRSAHGPILDPDALSRRAHNLTEKTKRKISTPRRGLDRPAPTGMTLLAYTAEPDSPSQDALNLLASWAATLDQATTTHTMDRV